MTFEMVEEITIYEAEKLKELLLEKLDDAELLLDMAKIQKIDIVGIQLLISFIKSAEARDKRVEFKNVSESLYEQIAASSCENILGLG